MVSDSGIHLSFSLKIDQKTVTYFSYLGDNQHADFVLACFLSGTQ